MNVIDLKGKRYNHLVVVKFIKVISTHAYWVCKCDCGKKIKARGSHLKTGSITSCGCFSRERSRIQLTKYANSPAHKGAGNPQWKGTKAGHSSIHTWLNRYYKKEKCEECDSKKNLDWALKKGKKHSHNRNNYKVLCRSHHLKYDYTKKRKQKISITLRSYA